MADYSFRVNRHYSMCLAKWTGNKEPEEVYTITALGKGKCDCQGSWRQPYCKHRKMVDHVLGILGSYKLDGDHLWGALYDEDKDLLYLSIDNEGIPMTGAVDIMEEIRHRRGAN